MMYSILIYGVDGVFDRLPAAEQEARMQQHRDLQAELAAKDALGPVVKLMSPTSAITVRQQGDSTVVLDGPFAETKEQFLGLYMVECDSIDEAIAAAKKLPQDISSYEIRPVDWAGGSLTTPE